MLKIADLTVRRPLPAAGLGKWLAGNWQRRMPRYAICLLLSGSFVLVTHQLAPHRAAAPAKVAASDPVPASLYDFQPSPARQHLIDSLRQGSLPRNSGVAELETEQRDTQVQLQQEQALVDRYYQDVLNRDSTINQLKQTVQADQTSLAAVAKQLGLPKDQLAPPPQQAQGGVGGALPIDQAALKSGAPAPASTGGKVATAQDLANRVHAYLQMPCPLPADDPRCGQAAMHAKQELARGHGLDVDRPDARPTLDMDITQPFGPTDEDLEPLEQVDGQLVHFH